MTGPATVARVELPVRGMTCAGCAARIERALQRGDGVVQAGVNFATGIASVEFDGARTDARQLCAIVAAAGYAAEPPAVDSGATAAAGFVAADELRLLGHDLAVTAALAVPVLALAMAHGVAALHAPWSRWTQAALTAGVLATGGRRFFRAAWAQARHGTAAMDALVALGTAAAFLFSLLLTAWPGALGTDALHPPVYFESAAAIVLFVLLGRWLEARARRRAGLAIGRLLDLQPRHARVERGGADVDVPVGELRAGDIVRLRPGETVPIDSEVLDGSSAVDESMLTGESVPVDKHTGAPVFAGTRNTTGALRLRTLRPAAASTLQQIVRLVQQAQGRRAPVAALADRVAGRFTPAVLIAAALTFGLWLWLGNGIGSGSGSDALPHAVVAAVAVLIIACPCAMGLATPVAILVGTGRSAERGVLWKGGDALELAARVDTVLLDKTGTLTSGRMTLAEVLPLPGVTAEALLALAAAAEHGSEHPLAAAVVAGARARGVAFAAATEFRALVGAGVSARVVGPDGDRRVLVGKAELLAEHGVDVAPLQGALAAVAAAARTPLLVAVDDRPAGVLALADAPRPEATAAVAALHRLGLQVLLVTGDRREVADAVGRALLIERVHAGMSPADKAALVQSLRQQGRRVAMVGDGINDAPALAAADVGIAIGSGTDVAIEAAGATLLRADLLAVPEAFVLARATLRTIRQNLGWAFGYNAAAVPLAAGALFPFTGWQLSPMLASAAMAASSVSVVLNSLRLRRAGLPRSEH